MRDVSDRRGHERADGSMVDMEIREFWGENQRMAYTSILQKDGHEV